MLAVLSAPPHPRTPGMMAIAVDESLLAASSFPDCPVTSGWGKAVEVSWAPQLMTYGLPSILTCTGRWARQRWLPWMRQWEPIHWNSWVTLWLPWACSPRRLRSFSGVGVRTMPLHGSEADRASNRTFVGATLYGWNWIIGIFNIWLFILPLPY